MRVLVTGLDGFTGKYLRDELEAHGHQAIGLQSDLIDLDALKKEIAEIKPEAVIHLAGISFINEHDINHIYQINLMGTRNLLWALFEFSPQVQNVILASTAYVYGNNPEKPLSEHSLVKPVNDYAVSKLSMEYMASLWNEKLPICIVRPFNYTGIGQSDRFLIPKIVSHFKMKKPIIELGNLDVEREFGDVRAVAEIYRKLLDKKPLENLINICTGKAHSLRQAIDLCQKITGHSIKIEVNSQFVRNNEVQTLVGSNQKLKKLIGDWTFYSFEDTLRWMLTEHS